MADFDSLAGQIFSTVIDLMGDRAVWQKSELESESANVLFKHPTEPIQIGDSEQYEYRPTQATAEYHKGNFRGLKQKTDAKIPQYLLVKGKKYLVTEVTSKFDGNTYVAHLEPCRSDCFQEQPQ
jgi:hypothetical protein